MASLCGRYWTIRPKLYPETRLAIKTYFDTSRYPAWTQQLGEDHQKFKILKTPEENTINADFSDIFIVRSDGPENTKLNIQSYRFPFSLLSAHSSGPSMISMQIYYKVLETHDDDLIIENIEGNQYTIKSRKKDLYFASDPTTLLPILKTTMDQSCLWIFSPPNKTVFPPVAIQADYSKFPSFTCDQSLRGITTTLLWAQSQSETNLGVLSCPDRMPFHTAVATVSLGIIAFDWKIPAKFEIENMLDRLKMSNHDKRIVVEKQIPLENVTIASINNSFGGLDDHSRSTNAISTNIK